MDFMKLIQQIYVVNSQGTNFYAVGMELNGSVIAEIKHTNLTFTGDPYSKYCGFCENGNLLFSLEPSMPLDIQYIPEK